MTNKEAIEVIKTECYIASLLNIDKTVRVNTALDMAIQALDQGLTVDGKVFDVSKARIKTYDKLGEYTLSGFYEKEKK